MAKVSGVDKIFKNRGQKDNAETRVDKNFGALYKVLAQKNIRALE
jgi:hypothetical protein